jgi:O-antigen ligase
MAVPADVEVYRPYKIGSALISVLFFITPVVSAAIPRLTWLFFPLIACLLILAAIRRGGEWQQLVQPNPTLIACLLVAGYILLDASWAADPGTAFGKGLLLAAVVLISFAASRAIPQVDEEQLRKATIAFSLGTFIAALFLIFELLTHGAITRLVLNSVEVLQRRHVKHADISNGELISLSLSLLNRNVNILTFSVWPALLGLKATFSGVRRAVFAAVLLAPVILVVVLSEHQSSQVAIIVSVAVFCLASLWRTPVIRALAVVWCLAFVLVLPMDFLVYKADLHMAHWLPNSFRARIIIWEYTAERVFDHPWLGVGADSTRVLKEPNTREMAEWPQGFIYPRTIGWHAHDLFLQTWFELGVIGALLIALAGAMVALRMSLLPVEAQPFASASFTAFMAISSFGWGMWQTWLICGAALLLIFLLVAAKVTTGEHHPSTP